MRLYWVPTRRGGALTKNYYAVPNSITKRKGSGKLVGGSCSEGYGVSSSLNDGVKSMSISSGSGFDKMDSLRKVLNETSLNLSGIGKSGKSGKQKIRL